MMKKIKKNLSKFEERMRKLELLPTRDCEARYGPGRAILPSAYISTSSANYHCYLLCNNMNTQVIQVHAKKGDNACR